MAKRIMLIVLAVIMTIVFAGCSMVTVNEERDGQRVVAKVNGEEILKNEVTGQIKLYLSNMGIMEDNADYVAYYDMYLEGVLESAVILELSKQVCEENGIELITAEQQAQIEEDVETMVNLAETLAGNNVLEEDYASDEKYQAALEAKKQEFLDMYGCNDGTYKQMLENEAITENVIAYLMKDYNPTEDDIKAYYDQQLADQKSVIDEQLSSFTTFENEGLLLYMPEGVRYIKYVLVEFGEDAVAALAEAESEEKDAVREEQLKTIKETADEALAAAKEDIDAAIEKYCAEGEPMHGETALEVGLRIFKGSTDYPTEVVEAAEELSAVGEMSDLIATDEGYYIIQMVGEEEAGEVAYEEIKDTVLEHMTSEKEENIFLTTSGEWMDEAEIKYYMDRLAYNG